MRALFLCIGDTIAAGALKGWLDAGHEVAEIWHAPHQGLRRSQRTLNRFAPDWSVYRLAQRHAVPMFCNPLLRKWTGALQRIDDIRADVLITAVTMQIVPPAIIDRFGGRAANFHPALLPHFRGPSPYLGQLLDERENEYGGMTLHQLAPGIDEGPIIGAIAVPFDSVGRDYRAWRIATAFAGRRLAREVLPEFFAGRIEAVPQGPGSYRRVPECKIGLASSYADVERVIEKVGYTGRVMAEGKSVRAVSADLGPPTGKRPNISALHVELDIADRRVRLRRCGPIERLTWRLDQLSAIRNLERQAQL